MVERSRLQAAKTPALSTRHLPAAEHLHRRQHVLRLRLHHVLDARRARDRRAVHRVRGRPRHARRPHRAHDQHDERISASSWTRSPTLSRSASRPRCLRLRGDWPISDAWGWAAGFVYLTAAAMRLARFNIQSPGQVDKRYFVGMPSPRPGWRRRRHGVRVALPARPASAQTPASGRSCLCRRH